MNVAPGSTFEAYSPETTSGLVGTVGVRIRDGVGADFLARTTASITEDVNVGSTSVYRRSFTAPTTAGQYWIVWDTGTALLDPVELVVTRSAVTPDVLGTVYVDATALKATLTLTGTSFADDDIDEAIETASRDIDEACDTRFFTAGSETRYFTGRAGDPTLDVGDLAVLTSVSVDLSGTGTFSSTYTDVTDFVKEPLNNANVDKPWDRLTLRTNRGLYWPTYVGSVQVVGEFGWLTTPSPIVTAASLLAERYLMRKRDAQLGVMVVPGLADGGAAFRISRTDPDVARLLQPYTKMQPLA